MIIDFHSHILPGVDHGSRDSEQTRKQLDIISGGGVDTVVATSHFYPHIHSVDSFLSKVNTAIETVSVFGENYRDTRICVGAEVLACEMINKMDGFDKLCIRGTRCLLLEMPTAIQWSRALMDTVENILADGYEVVLAHIDRYIKSRESEIDALLAMGAKAQINAESLTSIFSRKRLMPYIEAGVVCALGSDLHGENVKEYKPLTEAARYIGRENFDRIMMRSAQILRNAETINKNMLGR